MRAPFDAPAESALEAGNSKRESGTRVWYASQVEEPSSGARPDEFRFSEDASC
jgi:hypothetical protein